LIEFRSVSYQTDIILDMLKTRPIRIQTTRLKNRIIAWIAVRVSCEGSSPYIFQEGDMNV